MNSIEFWKQRNDEDRKSIDFPFKIYRDNYAQNKDGPIKFGA